MTEMAAVYAVIAVTANPPASRVATGWLGPDQL